MKNSLCCCDAAHQSNHVFSGLDKKILTERSLSWLKAVRAEIARWKHNRTTRHQLSHLDRRQLKDIGLSESDIYQELRKPFWKN